MTPLRKDTMDPQTDRIVAKLDALTDQVRTYRDEARRSVRPRRTIVGVWAAVAVAWIAAAAVSIVTVLALAERTAGVDDSKIGWVVFVAFAAAVVATFLAVARGGD